MCLCWGGGGAHIHTPTQDMRLEGECVPRQGGVRQEARLARLTSKQSHQKAGGRQRNYAWKVGWNFDWSLVGILVLRKLIESVTESQNVRPRRQPTLGGDHL